MPPSKRKIKIKKAATPSTPSPQKTKRSFERSESECIDRAIRLKLSMYAESQVANNLDENGKTVKQAVTVEWRASKKAKKHIAAAFWVNIISRH